VGLDAVPPLAVLASLPVGALATAVLVVNNVRDHETDVRAGKRTLVVRWGRRFGVVEYVSLLLLAYATPIVTTVLHRTGPLALLPLLTAPLGVVLARALHRERGRDLNPRLAGTAKLALLFSVLFAIGVAFG
jgi:1,4-dihydroxy-2-naphthoate polyprenyltransferase